MKEISLLNKILTTIYQSQDKELENIFSKEKNQKIKISNFINNFRKEKDEFKKKIKENLEILKYTAKVKRDISKAP